VTSLTVNRLNFLSNTDFYLEFFGIYNLPKDMLLISENDQCNDKQTICFQNFVVNQAINVRRCHKSDIAGHYLYLTLAITPHFVNCQNIIYSTNELTIM